MSKLAVIATLQVEPDRLEDGLAALRRHRDRCLRDEPGTLVFEAMVPRDEPGKVMLYEVYASQAAFDAHWNGPSIAKWREETGTFMKIASGLWGQPMD
jgi:quinol monooxygenase YgiN